MCQNDEYLTITPAVAEGIYSEKRSKFLAFAHHVESESEAKDIIAKYRKNYYDARHVCYAYMLGPERLTYKANDDGEPSSTAGKPILGQIAKNELTDTLIIVVRYFGGIKLGTSGLIMAYRTAAAEAIANAVIVKRYVEEVIPFCFPYELMNQVMKVVKDMSPTITSQNYEGNQCKMTFSIRKSLAASLLERLSKIKLAAGL